MTYKLGGTFQKMINLQSHIHEFADKMTAFNDVTCNTFCINLFDSFSLNSFRNLTFKILCLYVT